MWRKGLAALALTITACTPDVPEIEEPPTPATEVGASEGCRAPDLMFLLDRSSSMARRPDGSTPSAADSRESKWHLAADAIQSVSMQFHERVRFGLELFPRDPADGSCHELGALSSSGRVCDAADAAVVPELESGESIISVLDVDEPILCPGKPIAHGLARARADMSGDGRDRYAVLLTDGSDDCQPDMVLDVADELAAEGIRIFVVAVKSTVETDDESERFAHELLNNLACAGGTSRDESRCFTTTSAADHMDSSRALEPGQQGELYHQADSAEELDTVLAEIATQAAAICPGS